MLTSRRAAIALILFGVALWFGVEYWRTTWKLIPVSVPISLSRGHVRSEEFALNLDSGYVIEIEVDWHRTGNSGCLM